jgi:hypothetical protein
MNNIQPAAPTQNQSRQGGIKTGALWLLALLSLTVVVGFIVLGIKIRSNRLESALQSRLRTPFVIDNMSILGGRSFDDSEIEKDLDLLKFHEEHPHNAVQLTAQFKCLMPAKSMVKFVFVWWDSNGVPKIDENCSAYYRIGNSPLAAEVLAAHYSTILDDDSFPHGPKTYYSGTVWRVYLGHGIRGDSQWHDLPKHEEPYDNKGWDRLKCFSGEQISMPLLHYVKPGGGENDYAAAEIRIIVDPFDSPPVLSTPSEIQVNDSVGGSGLPGSQDEVLTRLGRQPPGKETITIIGL